MREHFSALPRAQMSVKILSNLGESALEYQVEYEYNKGDNDILTVTAPESLSGVRLTISGDTPGGFTLQYADAVLDFQMDGPAGMPSPPCSPIWRRASRPRPPPKHWTVCGRSA